MSRRILSILTLSVLTSVFAFGASAQELTHGQKRIFERARKEVEKAEGVFRRDPRSSTFKFYFTSAQRRLRTLPRDNPEVKKLQARLDRMDPTKQKKPDPKPDPKKPTGDKQTPGSGTAKRPTGKSSGSGAPKEPTEPGPEGYDKALDALKFAFQYKKWTREKVQAAPDFRKEKISSAIVRAGLLIERVPKGKHRDYLDWYFNWLENRLWPGHWKQRRRELLAEDKATRCYAILYRNTSQWGSPTYGSRDYAPEKVKAWGDRLRATLVKFQKARKLWDELIALDPKFNESVAARRNKRLRNMGTYAASLQRKMMAQALAGIEAKYTRHKEYIEQLKKRKHTPKGIVAEAKGIVLMARTIGAPEESLTKYKAFVGDVTEYVNQANADKAAELKKQIEQRTAPTDGYTGADKEKLRGLILAEWKKRHPKDEVLAVRMKMETWRRDTRWVWQSATKNYYKVDKSVLVASVIVKLDETYAMIYPAYVNKDHMKGDRLVIGAQTKGRGYVHRKMLVKNFK